MPSQTPSETAHILGGNKPISLKTLQRWRASGVGPDYIRVGGKIRYTSEAIQRYLDQNTVKCGEKS